MKKPVKKAPKDLPKLIAKLIFLLFWVATAVLASQLVVGVILAILVGVEQLNRPLWTAIYSAASYVLAMILIILIPNRLAEHNKLNIKKMGREDLGLKGWLTWTDIGLAPIGFVVYLVLAASLVWIFSHFPWFDAEQAQDVGFNILISSFDRAVAFTTLVIVAPIAEEIIFRGWLYAKIKYTLIGRISEKAAVALTILLVSTLFGLLHMQWNVGVNVFAMSVVMCFLREITGTTYAGILLHILKNGLAFYLLYMVGIS